MLLNISKTICKEDFYLSLKGSAGRKLWLFLGWRLSINPSFLWMQFSRLLK